MKFNIGDITIFPNGEVDEIKDIINELDCLFLSKRGLYGYEDELRLFEDNIEEYLYSIKIDGNKHRCKYWNIEVERTLNLIGILYDVYEEVCGGMLHIVTDDDNIEDGHIEYCIGYANESDNRNRKDYKITIAIAERYLKHSMKERMLLTYCFMNCNKDKMNCEKCFVELGYEAWDECSGIIEDLD